MTTRPDPLSEQQLLRWRLQRHEQDKYAPQEAAAPKPTPPASVYRGALFAALPSLCLWVPVGLVLAWGAFKLLSEFMALGSNFLR